jgi:two-component system, NarL family, nitrate/nitrite response regulator NarL
MVEGCISTVLLGRRGLVREGLTRILSAANFSILASAERVDDVPSAALSANGTILLVIQVDDDENVTLNEVALFKEHYPGSRVALLADRQQLSNKNLLPAFRAGVDAYFVDPKFETLIRSLELVMLGETIVPTRFLPYILRQPNASVASGDEAKELRGNYIPRLSDREKCVLKSLVEGQSNKSIARSHRMAEATVKVHIKAILRKIRVRNRTQAAIWALSNDGVLDEPAPVFSLTSSALKVVAQ